MKIVKDAKLWFASFIIFSLFASTALAGAIPTNTVMFADNSSDKITITYGQKTSLGGFFWFGTGAYEQKNGIDDRSIDVWRSSVNAPEFENYLFSVITFNADVDGTIRYLGIFDTGLLAPTRNYDYGAFFDGSRDPYYADSNNGEFSNIVTIYVRVVISHAAKRYSSKRILRLSGKVRPTHKKKPVVIKVRKKGSRRWSTLAKVYTNSYSNYAYNWRYGSRKGVYYTKAVFPADSDHAKNTSKIVASRL